MGSVPPQLELQEVLPPHQGIEVSVGVSAGRQYLVMAMAGRSGPWWVCAPASDRAVACVRNGRASPWTVTHHSATGTVDVYRTALDGSVSESVVLCSQLPSGRTVLAAA
jgi:hypothetical protein